MNDDQEEFLREIRSLMRTYATVYGISSGILVGVTMSALLFGRL